MLGKKNFKELPSIQNRRPSKNKWEGNPKDQDKMIKYEIKNLEKRISRMEMKEQMLNKKYITPKTP